MKKLSIAALLLCASVVTGMAQGSEYVQGHIGADGTYHAGYFRTQKDNTPNDNYGYSRNNNPYTGATGNRRVTHQEGDTGTYQGRQVVFQNGEWKYVR